MNTASLVRAARGGAFTAVLAGMLGGTMFLQPVAAAPLTCTDSPVAAIAADRPVGSAAATLAAIPTQASIEPETNPPGDIPDNQAFVPYTSVDGGYTISMPEGWARTEEGPNVRFADKLHTFTVEVACATSAPTVDSVNAVEAPQIAEGMEAFELVEVKAIELPVGPAVLVRYRANSAPDDVTNKQYRLDVERYEVFNDGKLAVISLAVPAGSDNVDVANLVSRSFRWTA
jgi:hypothetical protein